MFAKEVLKWALRKTWFSEAEYHPAQADRPFLIRLDTTNRCNLACKKCFYPAYMQSPPDAHCMSVDDFRVLAGRVFPYAYGLQLSCSFEPLLHPQFGEILTETGRYGVPNVGLVTNGTLLDGERADAILSSQALHDLSVSINSLDPATYANLHGRPGVERVRDNVERFLTARRTRNLPFPRVKINTVVMRSNLNELETLLDWAARIGADCVQFAHVEPFGPENDESVVTLPDRYNAVRERLVEQARTRRIETLTPPPLRPEFRDPERGGYRWPEPEEKAPVPFSSEHPYPAHVPCICPWMTLVIDCRGNLYPCAPRTNRPPFANILRQEIPQALNSIRILRLRKALLRGQHRAVCAFCKPAGPYGDPMRRRVRHLNSTEESDSRVSRP
ncbi:MAG TPA: radical SAM/SPASM domain-containing protein [Candidatus Sumerlaeota bacterium]|nr:radical SAM/SPASM domain-containing protein [Candidatus Sumerlaeota bacterium]